MNPGLKVAVSGLILLAGAGAWAQSLGQAATIGALQVKEVGIAEVDQTHVKATVNLVVVPAQSVTLANLRLCSLRLNGQPVFAAPLNQEIPLKKGVTTALPPLYITILFRDLYTVDPLRQMIDKQSVHIDGEMIADLRLNVLERLALGTQHPKVAIALNQDVPAEFGGSPLQRSLASAVLVAIDAGLKAKGGAVKLLPNLHPVWVRDLEARALPNLMVTESRYAIKGNGGNYPVSMAQLSFLVGPQQAITTAEVQAPWKYDTEILGEMESGGLKLDKKSLTIVVSRPWQNSASLTLAGNDFSVVLRGITEKDKVAMNGSDNQVKVLRRSTPGSLAVLALGMPDAAPGLPVVTPAIAAQDHWEQAVVFRLRQDPATKALTIEGMQIGARRQGNGIALSEPVDSAVFGSPILTPDGVVGMVQDEQTGTFLPAEMYVPAQQPVPQSVPQPEPQPAQDPQPAPQPTPQAAH